jgi:hypothetical protein
METDRSSADLVFTTLLIINSAFCLFYVIHGLLKELQFEIYMFIFAAIFILGYCIIEYAVESSHRNRIKMVRLILGCIFGPINIYLAIKIAREFGWLEFRIVGASEQMQSMYHQATLFASLLKFDLQAAVSFVILVSMTSQLNSSKMGLEGILVLSIGLPFCILWTALGRASMRQEWKCGTVVFAVLGLLTPAYVIYSVVMIFLQNPQLGSLPIIITSEYVVGGLALLVRGILYIELFIVYRNYGKGLRQRAFDDEANERTGLLAR